MINKELIKKLAGQLRDDGVDAIVVAPGGDLRFLLGHSPHLCERFQGMFIKSDETLFYFCNTLFVAFLMTLFITGCFCFISKTVSFSFGICNYLCCFSFCFCNYIVGFCFCI